MAFELFVPQLPNSAQMVACVGKKEGVYIAYKEGDVRYYNFAEKKFTGWRSGNVVRGGERALLLDIAVGEDVDKIALTYVARFSNEKYIYFVRLYKLGTFFGEAEFLGECGYGRSGIALPGRNICNLSGGCVTVLHGNQAIDIRLDMYQWRVKETRKDGKFVPRVVTGDGVVVFFKNDMGSFHWKCKVEDGASKRIIHGYVEHVVLLEGSHFAAIVRRSDGHRLCFFHWASLRKVHRITLPDSGSPLHGYRGMCRTPNGLLWMARANDFVVVDFRAVVPVEAQ